MDNDQVFGHWLVAVTGHEYTTIRNTMAGFRPSSTSEADCFWSLLALLEQTPTASSNAKLLAQVKEDAAVAKQPVLLPASPFLTGAQQTRGTASVQGETLQQAADSSTWIALAAASGVIGAVAVQTCRWVGRTVFRVFGKVTRRHWATYPLQDAVHAHAAALAAVNQALGEDALQQFQVLRVASAGGVRPNWEVDLIAERTWVHVQMSSAHPVDAAVRVVSLPVPLGGDGLV
ncbi:hypothetical protein [Glycomyces tritici]|uniref:Uncharacterized protein n=1 Tax=Glycomyces tritici TaxID=2665176 RepID=A0ABT7YWM6_9ACTN|nr:hypothetical protein [Glycomyces tritici]MDN3243030.1 hypothetical protein [Glycomyces tritici]